MVNHAEQFLPPVLNITTALQESIVDVVKLYADKYDADFREYIPRFIALVWNLAVSCMPQPRHDLLATMCMDFLGKVVRKLMYRELFLVRTSYEHDYS